MHNFNMGFSNNKADVLIHLTQWQYWWWFWFSFLWVLYYLLVARVFRYRTLKFNPRIASTLRPHGKWGDLLTCIIPVTWCINILINSNFILKLIEWQSESSLFTLRVRAKQWYWIYKLDLRNVADIFSTPRNLGRNKWQFSTFGDLQTAEDYLHIMQIRACSNWSKEFWFDLNKKSTKKNSFNASTPVEVYRSEFINNSKTTLKRSLVGSKNLLVNQSYLDKKPDSIFSSLSGSNNSILSLDVFLESNNIFKKDSGFFKLSEENKFFEKDLILLNFGDDSKSFKNTLLHKDQFQRKESRFQLLSDSVFRYLFVNKYKSINSFIGSSVLNDFDLNTGAYQHPELDDETRILKRSSGKTTPIRILKGLNSSLFFHQKHTGIVNDSQIELFKFRFNEVKSTLGHKPIKPTVYLTFKQKRYNQRVNIVRKNINFIDKYSNKSELYSGNPFLKNLSIIDENFGNPTKQYRLVKKTKARLDTTKVSTWNRLLRSRRVLVLPAHVNITVITNSFDVVHSWHIPGLGLKMDCLPGRATHHTLYIDNVGLYYGQCAEVCGRYHHHMPIRVCALPFEHFLVWWHTFGLPKFLFPKNNDKVKMPVSKYFSRKFSW